MPAKPRRAVDVGFAMVFRKPRHQSKRAPHTRKLISPKEEKASNFPTAINMQAHAPLNQATPAQDQCARAVKSGQQRIPQA